jgi:hypothetical protein
MIGAEGKDKLGVGGEGVTEKKTGRRGAHRMLPHHQITHRAATHRSHQPNLHQITTDEP